MAASNVRDGRSIDDGLANKTNNSRSGVVSIVNANIGDGMPTLLVSRGGDVNADLTIKFKSLIKAIDIYASLGGEHRKVAILSGIKTLQAQQSTEEAIIYLRKLKNRVNFYG